MFKNRGLAQSELAHVGETLLVVSTTAGVDYLANHLSLLPFNAIVVAMLSPLVLAIKYYLDGQKPAA